MTALMLANGSGNDISHHLAKKGDVIDRTELGRVAQILVEAIQRLREVKQSQSFNELKFDLLTLLMN
jgi:hypothetical protein